MAEEGVKIVEQESWLEQTLKMPGAISIVFLLSILLPMMGWPLAITLPLLISFSVPTIYVFFMMVILNRHISLKKQLPIVVIASMFLYIISRAPATPSILYVHIALFIIGLGISTLSYFIYYLLYRFGKRIWGMEEIMYRRRFITLFVPTLAIMLVILFLLGGMPIGVEDEEVITIVGWLVKITGGL